MTLADLAAAIGADLDGDGGVQVDHVASLESARPGALAGLFELRWRKAAARSAASAVVVERSLAHHLPPATARLLADDPRDAWGRAVRVLNPRPSISLPPVGVDARAAVDPSAEVHPEARVGPFVTIGAGAHVAAGAALLSGAYVGAGARIGVATVLHPRATVLDGCEVGDRVLLCAGAIVGSPGFGIDAAGRVPHLGRVVVEDDVTIGAHSCVDRGSLDDTRVCAGAHIDNLVQVGHNAYIGRGAVLCAQVGLCGGARVEAGAVLAGQSAVNAYTTVGPGARVAGQSGVTRSVAGGADYSGTPAEPNRARLKRIARLKKLAEPR